MIESSQLQRVRDIQNVTITTPGLTFKTAIRSCTSGPLALNAWGAVGDENRTYEDTWKTEIENKPDPSGRGSEIRGHAVIKSTSGKRFSESVQCHHFTAGRDEGLLVSVLSTDRADVVLHKRTEYKEKNNWVKYGTKQVENIEEHTSIKYFPTNRDNGTGMKMSFKGIAGVRRNMHRVEVDFFTFSNFTSLLGERSVAEAAYKNKLGEACTEPLMRKWFPTREYGMSSMPGQEVTAVFDFGYNHTAARSFECLVGRKMGGPGIRERIIFSNKVPEKPAISPENFLNSKKFRTLASAMQEHEPQSITETFSTDIARNNNLPGRPMNDPSSSSTSTTVVDKASPSLLPDMENPNMKAKQRTSVGRGKERILRTHVSNTNEQPLKKVTFLDAKDSGAGGSHSESRSASSFMSPKQHKNIDEDEMVKSFGNLSVRKPGGADSEDEDAASESGGCEGMRPTHLF